MPSIPSLKEVVEAIQAGWFVTLVISISCGVTLWGISAEHPYFNSVAPWVVSAVAIVGVFSSTAFCFTLLVHLAKVVQYVWRWRQRSQLKKELQNRMSNLNPEERNILSYLFSINRQYFDTRIGNEKIQSLRHKKLVIMLGDQANYFNWPHKVSDVAWEYMENHKEDFLIDVPPGTTPPYVRSAWV